MTAPLLAVPTTAEDLRETLTNKTKLSTLINEGQFPEFMTNYVNTFHKANADVSQQVQEQIDTAFANFARENQVELRKGSRKGPLATKEELRTIKATASNFSQRSDGAKLDGKFTDLMDFLGTIDTRVDPRGGDIGEKRAMIKNAMSSTDPSAGGFLIPEEFRSELLRVALETAVVRPRARVIPMSSLRASMPMIDSTTNNGSVYGGVIAFWTEEAAALAQSQPTFGRIVLEAKKLTAYTEVPNETVSDSAISVESLLNEIFPEAIAWFEDIAFLRGTGVGEPLGIFNPLNSAIVQQGGEAGQAGSTVLWENIIGMYSRMLPSSLGKAVWVVSPNTFPQLATMALSVGTGGSAVWLNNGVEGPPASILGRPVIISEKIAALGGVGDINFVDFSQYLVGDRMSMDAKVSTDFRFGNDMTAYRFIERVDGRPWLQSAITPSNGGPTLSPYVTLAARP